MSFSLHTSLPRSFLSSSAPHFDRISFSTPLTFPLLSRYLQLRCRVSMTSTKRVLSYDAVARVTLPLTSFGKRLVHAFVAFWPRTVFPL